MTGKALLEDGWTEFRINDILDDNARQWYKVAGTETKCNHNQRPNGVQVVLKYWSLSKHDEDQGAYSLHLTAETEKGRWPNISVDAGQTIEQLASAVLVLLVGWEAIAGGDKDDA